MTRCHRVIRSVCQDNSKHLKQQNLRLSPSAHITHLVSPHGFASLVSHRRFPAGDAPSSCCNPPQPFLQQHRQHILGLPLRTSSSTIDTLIPSICSLPPSPFSSRLTHCGTYTPATPDSDYIHGQHSSDTSATTKQSRTRNATYRTSIIIKKHI